ncbi:hypothetical protein WJ973_05770 [Achromobacter xylosoxidans]
MGQKAATTAGAAAGPHGFVAGHIEPGEQPRAHQQTAAAALVFRQFGAQFPQSRA